MKPQKNITEMLIDAGIITKEQLTIAEKQHKIWGGKLEHTMIQLGYFDHEFLADLKSEQYHIPRTSILKKEINEKLLTKFSKDIIIKHTFLPIDETATHITMCIADPENLDAIEIIQKISQKKVSFVLDTEKALTKAINHYFHTELGARELTPIEIREEKIFEKTLKSLDRSACDIFQRDAFRNETNTFLLNAIFSLENGLKTLSLKDNKDYPIQIKLQKLITLLNKKGFRIPSYEDNE